MIADGGVLHPALAGLALHPFVLSMTVPFRRTDVRRGVLVEGPVGWGEFSPFDDYGPDVTRAWAASAIAAATEVAPPALRDSIAVNVTVPAEAPADAFARVVASGATTAKVKVAEPGQTLEDDLARVAAVRDALGTAGAIRVDANGAWDLATAALVVPRLALAAGGLEYVEQPCASLEEMALLRRRVAVPLAADESVRTAADPRRVALAGAADVVVIKVQPLGGVARALEVVAAAGLPAVVSSALESSVGLATGLALACAIPGLDRACGLGTATLLTSDVTTTPLVAEQGMMRARVVTPDPASLAAAAPPPDEARRLLERLVAALGEGTEGRAS